MLRSEEKEEQVTRSDRSRKQNGRAAKAFSNVGVRGFDKDRISLSRSPSPAPGIYSPLPLECTGGQWTHPFG